MAPGAGRLNVAGGPSSARPGSWRTGGHRGGYISRLQTIGGESDSNSRQLARYVKEVGENDATGMNIALRWRRDRYLRSGDHVPFLERGFAAVRFTEPNENYDHEHQDVRVENGVQFGDLPQFVDFDFLARVTRVLTSTLEAIARSPRPPLSTRAISANLTTTRT